MDDHTLRLEAMIADDAGKMYHGAASGPAANAEHIGQSLAQRLRMEARI
jgi:hypothetical protein